MAVGCATDSFTAHQKLTNAFSPGSLRQLLLPQFFFMSKPKINSLKYYWFLVIELIDECEDGVDDCSINAMCTDARYLYNCTCNDGYSGNGKTCTGM